MPPLAPAASAVSPRSVLTRRAAGSSSKLGTSVQRRVVLRADGGDGVHSPGADYRNVPRAPVNCSGWADLPADRPFPRLSPVRGRPKVGRPRCKAPPPHMLTCPRTV